MNKLKALLIAGLLSLTSVSFATSLTTTTDTNGNVVYTAEGARGVINLLDDGNVAQLTGDFTVANGYDELYEISTVNYGSEYLMSFGRTTNSSTQGDPVNIALYTGSQFYNTLGDSTSGIAATFVDASNTAFSALLDITQNYFLLVSGTSTYGYSVDVSAVPVPAAGILFASALFGAGALGRRKKKAKASVVGAFARAS